MGTVLTATVVAAEFVSDGDKYRDNQDDPPRPAGTYLTIRLDDDDAAVVAGKVSITYLPNAKEPPN